MLLFLFSLIFSYVLANGAYNEEELTLSGAYAAFIVSMIHFAADPRFGALVVYSLCFALETREHKDGLPWSWMEKKCMYTDQANVIKALEGGILGHYCCCYEHTAFPKALRKGMNGVKAAAIVGCCIRATYATAGWFLVKCPGTFLHHVLT